MLTIASAIKTYNGQGVAAPGVIKSHHAIIFTGSQPRPDVSEQPQRLPNGQPEIGMQPQAIRIIPYDREKALDPMARLDFGDRYEFDYGVPNIRPFGRVHDDSQAALFVQYNAVWATIQRAAHGTVPRPAVQIVPQTTEISTQRIDLASATSGPITDDQMRMLLQRYREYAQKYSLSMPNQAMSAEQVHSLALSPERRAMWAQRIKDLWELEGEEFLQSDSD